jgi:hypothetical protein
VITVNKSQRQAVQEAKKLLIEELQGINGKDLQLAVLAEVVNDFLAGQKESKKTANDIQESSTKITKII